MKGLFELLEENIVYHGGKDFASGVYTPKDTKNGRPAELSFVVQTGTDGFPVIDGHAGDTQMHVTASAFKTQCMLFVRLCWHVDYGTDTTCMHT